MSAADRAYGGASNNYFNVQVHPLPLSAYAHAMIPSTDIARFTLLYLLGGPQYSRFWCYSERGTDAAYDATAAAAPSSKQTAHRLQHLVLPPLPPYAPCTVLTPRADSMMLEPVLLLGTIIGVFFNAVSPGPCSYLPTHLLGDAQYCVRVWCSLRVDVRY
eukprot:2972222-Rhodomonas_salina.3